MTGSAGSAGATHSPRPTRSYLPRWALIPAAVGIALVVLPIAGLATQVSWSDFLSVITSGSAREALWLSIRTSTAATALCVVLGVPLAAVLARSRHRAVTLVRPIILLPLVLPPVVGGIALLYTFGRAGLIGRHLLGGQIAFSTTAVVIAQTFVSLPFLVLTVEGALRTTGTGFDDVAATLGARPRTVWWRVTMPLVMPGVIAGAVLAFARSLGEFGATLTFAGSLEGVTRTLPLEIYLRNETEPATAVALAFVLVVVAIIVVAAVYARSRSTPSAL